VAVTVDRKAVIRAAVFTLTLLVPVYVVIEVVNAVAGIHNNSWFWYFGFLAIFLIMAVGGARGAALRPEAPYSHAVLTTLTAFVPLVAVLLVAAVIRNGPSGLLDAMSYVLFAALFFMCAGLFGAMVVASRRQRTRDRRRHVRRSP
jgi:hypothetical protein